MAKTLIVKITCDQCKAEGVGDEVIGDESVTFAYDGYSYGLDLCADHAAEFHKTMDALISLAPERERIAAAIRRGRPSSSESSQQATVALGPARKPARRDREQLQAIREWANSHGYKVSTRGRIPGEVEQAFHDSFKSSRA
jgi:hypothetical protein